MFCPSCGTQSPSDQKFCKSCGTTLGAVSNAPAVAPFTPTPMAAPFAQPVPPPPVSAPYPQAMPSYPPPPAPPQYPQAPPPFIPPGATPAIYQPYPGVPPQMYASGNKPKSKSRIISIIISCLVLLTAGIRLATYLNHNHKSVTIGTKDQVIYSGTATQADATALGNALKSDGYFQDRGVTVQIDKGSGGTTISFVVQDGVWTQTSTLSSFEEIVREVAPSVGGFPVQLQLDNTKMDVEATSTVGEVTFTGGDAVYYEGSATQAQAQSIGNQFVTMGFFKGNGANVFLTKHSDGTTLAFVVADGTWNNASLVTDFETIVRSVAPAAGGLPIDMRLLNTQLQVEKDEVLN